MEVAQVEFLPGPAGRVVADLLPDPLADAVAGGLSRPAQVAVQLWRCLE